MAGVALRLGRRAARHRGAVARHWFRRQWTWRSTRTRPGRPSTDATVRTLVGKMAAANPLVGSAADSRRIVQAGHRGLGADRVAAPPAKDPPTPRRVQTPTEGRVVAFSEVGGLHHRY